MPRSGFARLLLLVALVLPGGAQIVPGAEGRPALAQSPPEGVFPLKLGDSSVDLTGPWKFRTGDDPAWANPDFDDSAWDSMDFASGKGPAGAGWTRRGYPGYAGFAWYRLRINVSGATHRLELKMPDQADDAYQVYVNGQLVGEFGKFDGRHVKAYPASPRRLISRAMSPTGPRRSLSACGWTPRRVSTAPTQAVCTALQL